MSFSPAIGGFNDEPLREFLADKEVRSVEPSFFLKDGTPYWSVCVAYSMGDTGIEPSPLKSSGNERGNESWRKAMKKGDWPLFNALREWRAAKATRTGVPAYLVFTNRQLSEIVINRPDSLSALGQISRIGPSRVEKYGKEVLEIIHGYKSDSRETDTIGAESTDGMDEISGMAVRPDGKVSEKRASHPDESD